jgi:large subunit ribosomal protein L7A
MIKSHSVSAVYTSVAKFGGYELMSYERLKQASILRIGTKQTIKSVEQGEVTEVYVAKDADPRITAKVIHLCIKHHIPVIYVDSMKQLGKSCGIEVGAAMVGIKFQ